MPKIRLNKELRDFCTRHALRGLRLEFETKSGGTFYYEGCYDAAEDDELKAIVSRVIALHDTCEAKYGRGES